VAYLAAVFFGQDRSYNVHHIRELTAAQLAEHGEHYSDFLRLRQRLSLLHALGENYSALKSFIHELQAASRVDGNRALSETNRHFMNYLSAAYALREHLTTALRRDFGRSSMEMSRFRTFLNLLEQKCFAYAFFQDFRNYVQHCGFPVGEMRLVAEGTTRSLELAYSKSALLAEYKKWEKSCLSQRPEISFDLVALIGAHHGVVIKEFPVAILAEYGKNIHRADAYFRGLHREAAKINPDSHARIVVSVKGVPSKGKVTFQDIPLDPLGELGLSGTSPVVQASTLRPGQILKVLSLPALVGKPDSTTQKALRIVSFKTEEVDREFEIQKHDIVGFHPSMVNLDYDPFPTARLDEVVDRVPMGRELILHAKLKGPVGSISLGMLLAVGGHKFAPTRFTEHFDMKKDDSEFDVEATEWLAYTEPFQLIAELRRRLAEARGR
jgi:hypothetical protein